MIHLDLILFVDNNAVRVAELKSKLLGKMDSKSLKVAVNGEHGILCLDHFEMCQMIKGKKILVVLNLETPVMDGFYFLDKLKNQNYLNKSKIAVLAIDNVTSEEVLTKAFSKGILSKINEGVNIDELSSLLLNFFSEKEEPRFRIPDKPRNLPLTI